MAATSYPAMLYVCLEMFNFRIIRLCEFQIRNTKSYYIMHLILILLQYHQTSSRVANCNSAKWLLCGISKVIRNMRELTW